MTNAIAATPSTMTNDPAPINVDKPWSRFVMVFFALTGLLTPYVCLAVAPVAFAVSDQDDGFLLAGIGGAHLLLTWALFGAF